MSLTGRDTQDGRESRAVYFKRYGDITITCSTRSGKTEISVADCRKWLQQSPSARIYALVAPSHTDSRLNHRACFGQQDISTHDTRRDVSITHWG